MLRKLTLIAAGPVVAAITLFAAAPAHAATSYYMCTNADTACIQDPGLSHFLIQHSGIGGTSWSLVSDGLTYQGNKTYEIKSGAGHCMSAVYGTYAKSVSCADTAAERFWIGSTDGGLESLIASVGVSETDGGTPNCENASHSNNEWNNVACPGPASAAFDLIVA